MVLSLGDDMSSLNKLGEVLNHGDSLQSVSLKAGSSGGIAHVSFHYVETDG